MEKILSIDKMKYLASLGLDISDASMCYNPSGQFGLVEKFNTEGGLWKDISTGKYQRIKFMEYEGISPYCYDGEYMPAYTLTDILKKLPTFITPLAESVKYSLNLHYNHYVDKWQCSYVMNGAAWQIFCDDEPIECVYQMLVWTIKEKSCGGCG